MKTRASLDSLEKDAPPDKTKDKKEKKEKRGMLGGMFKRKDKKSKNQDKESDDVVDKSSGELSRQSPTPKESMESLTQDGQGTKVSSLTPQPYRQTSKLQKTPPASLSPKSSYSTQRDAPAPRQGPVEQKNTVIPEPSRAPPPPAESNSSMHLILPETRPLFYETPMQPKASDAPRQAEPNESPKQYSPKDRSSPKEYSPKDRSGGWGTPFVNSLKPTPPEAKPEPVIQPKQRMPIEDFDSASSEEPTEPSSTRESHETQESDRIEHHPTVTQPTAPTREAPKPLQTEPPPVDRLSESPIHVPSQEQRTLHQPPPLMADSSTPSSRNTSPVSALSTPSLVEAPSAGAVDEPTPLTTRNPETPDQASTSTTPTWSDAGLRAYLDDDAEIRDLLIVVHDKSGATPRRDHPVVQGLYKEENAKLGEIGKRLDGLLGEYLGRKRGIGAR